MSLMCLLKQKFLLCHNVVVCITEDRIIDWQTVAGQGEFFMSIIMF